MTTKPNHIGHVIVWKAVAVAPLLVPVLIAGSFIASTESRNPLAGFFFLAIIGCIFSYAITLLGFVPALAIASRFVALSRRAICVLGALIGLAAAVPYMYIEWHASGADSGPPSTSFISHLARDMTDPLVWMVFPGGGLITAMAYVLLARGWAPRGAASGAAD
jgi:hypothetical protein